MSVGGRFCANDGVLPRCFWHRWEQKAARGSRGGLARGHHYIRTKRAAADLAATGELIRGMPRGRELEQLASRQLLW
jgi:hypothetical protein